MKLKFLSLLFFAVLNGFVLSAQNQSFITKLPIVYIDTDGQDIVNDPRINAKMQIAWNENGDENSTSDPPTHFDGNIAIEIRGSSSQMFPKKSYGFELKDETWEDMDFPLIGMPAEEDWILYAPYSDKSLIRNVLTFTLAAQYSEVYVPRCRFVELFLNNEYDGVYVLMEKIKRDSVRVDIAKLKKDDIEGEELTGGYIVKIDKSTGSGGDGWHSQFKNSNNSETFYQYEYPKYSKIKPEQKEYIADYINRFESAVYYSLTGEEDGFQNYMNSESFYDFVIMNELTKNVDGYRLSTFLYKDKNDKLTAGPLWDFNLSFGNADYYKGWETTGLQVFADLGDDYWQVPFWWQYLVNNAFFSNPMKCRWETLRETILSDEHILAVADSLVDLIQPAANRNFHRWPILGEYVWPNYFVGDTYDSEIDWIKKWIVERTRSLDVIFPGTCGEEPDKPPVEFSYSISPNPFTTKTILQITSEDNLFYHFHLYSINGQLIKAIQFKTVKGENSIELNTTKLSSGVFIYRLQKGTSEVYSGKIIKL